MQLSDTTTDKMGDKRVFETYFGCFMWNILKIIWSFTVYSYDLKSEAISNELQLSLKEVRKMCMDVGQFIYLSYLVAKWFLQYNDTNLFLTIRL